MSKANLQQSTGNGHTDLNLGATIKGRRNELGLSQHKLGELVGCHGQTINKLERGEIEWSRYLVPLEKHLKLSPGALTKDGGSKRQAPFAAPTGRQGPLDAIRECEAAFETVEQIKRTVLRQCSLEELRQALAEREEERVMRPAIGIRTVWLAFVMIGATAIGAANILKSEAASGTIHGPARILDGDTVSVAGTKVRLKGLDAEERGSVRGEAARRMMITIVGSSPLTCALTNERTHDRRVGYCTTASGTDIGQALVISGLALACPRYSDRYLKYETASARAVQSRAHYCVRGAR